MTAVFADIHPQTFPFSAAVGNSVCITLKDTELASPLTRISGSEGSFPTPRILLQTRCTVSSALPQIFSPSSHCTSLTLWIPPPTHPNTPPVLCTNIPFQALSSALDGPRILPAAPIPSPGDTHHPRSLIQRAHPPGKPGCLGMNEGRPSPSLFVDPSRSSIYQQSFLVSPRRL